MIDKREAYSILEFSLERLCGVKVGVTQCANMYEFEKKEKKYVLFHRHKNETGSLMVHFSPNALEKFEQQAGERIAVIGYTIDFFNPSTECNELVMLVMTVENLRRQLKNPYNTSVLRGAKTNNIILKFDSYSLSILERENDFLTVRFCMSDKN